jgi:antimicrobial peptide system SdpA family protein
VGQLSLTHFLLMKESKTLTVFFIVVASLWITAFFFVFVSALPFNAVTPKGQNFNIKVLLPEGWGFFTRNPREPYILFFKKENDQWKHCLSIPNSNYKNYFGLKRNARAEGIEYSFLIKDIVPEQWVKLDSDVISDREYSLLKVFEVSNRISEPHICGDILVVRREYIPWAWSATKKNIIMPSMVVRLKVKC